ncbi:uncharacterized protein YggE [Oikeobacillus pervagus]|uniref:Uncharacterized protein YggE n=1 Tax=Oikeobacillus pervagus TaxID=1325931 RepID=A0AAJ1WJZ2_9BACI|nr:SIMPL domain-containing protein [Oikeobacillus pervagus]MDQ0215988.1 uncharacterized protein YggE [Oikeobacillus pervagus]
MTTRHRPTQIKKLHVNGDYTIFVTPDQVQINIGIVTEGKNVTDIQKRNAETTSAVISAILQLGIANEKIKTTEFRIEPVYDFENGQQHFIGYRVIHQLQVNVSDIALIGPVIDQAIANGATSVSNIQFSVSHPERYYQNALKKAIEEAHQKAIVISQTIDAVLNPTPLKIEELSNRPVPYQSVQLFKSSATPIQPGEMAISANVKVEYQYFPRHRQQ